MILAPLWERLGYIPDLVVKRQFRDPKVILEEFREEEKKTAQRKQLKLEREAKERSQGMSAAAAKRTSTRPSQSRNQSIAPSRKQLKADETETEAHPNSVDLSPHSSQANGSLLSSR